MDIGDLIFPLLIIGGIIVQWLTNQADQKKKREQRDSSTGAERPRYEEVEEGKQDNPFDDLLEALGRTSRGESSQIPTPTPQTQTPPPLVRQSEPAREFATAPTPSRTDPLKHQRQLLEQKRREVAKLKNTKTNAPISALPGKLDTVRSGVVPQRLKRIRRTLRDREDIRQAIVLNEILQKPVSLR